MLRNKEFVYYYSVLISLLLIGVIGAFYFNRLAGLLILFLSLMIILIEFIFYRWRYKEIANLSDYLRQISHGHYELDLRDNQEGELSLLKSEIYKVTLRLRESAELLAQEKECLTDAISDISHQLKTPLTSMRIMNDLLSDASLDSNRRVEFTLQIQNQLTRLEWLVSSLLKLSKLETKTVTFKQEDMLMSDFINQVVEPFEIGLEVKEQSLEIFGDDFYLHRDLKWTLEAVTNVLKNAIEHTPVGGKVTITYHDNPIFSEIVISDTGDGIDKEDLPYLFKRFYRGKNPQPGSVGIGLAMAKSIMQQQGGDILVESKQGVGSRFYLKFYKL